MRKLIALALMLCLTGVALASSSGLQGSGSGLPTTSQWYVDSTDIIVNDGNVTAICLSDGVTCTTIGTAAGATVALDNLASVLFNTDILSANAGGAAIRNATASITVPTLIPNKSELDTGWGWTTDALYGVLGGVTEYGFSTTTLDLNSNSLTEVADVFVDDGGTFGISGNELFTVNSAGNFTISGATLAMSAAKITGVADPTNAQDVSTKEYTDKAVAGTSIDLFWNDVASDIGGIYTVMDMTPTGAAETTIVTAALGAGVDLPLNNYATIANEPGLTTLVEGVYEIHFHAEKTAGTKVVDNIYSEFYKRAAGGTETLLATSEDSGPIIGIKSDETLHFTISDDIDILATDRLVVKLLADVSGGGTDAAVTIYQEGTNASRFEFNTTSDVTDSRYLVKTGLSGGQVAIGGSDANDDITFQTTSNVTKGSYIFTELNTANGLMTTDGSGVVTSTLTPSGLTSIGATTFTGALTGNADTVTGFTPASGSLTLAGADAVTFTTTAATNVTSPTTGTLATLAGTEALTNKEITKRVVTTTDDATAVIDVDVTDVYELTAIANATVFTITGTPTDGQQFIVRYKDAGVTKGLTWTGFTAIGITLPTDTTAGKWDYNGCTYNLGATAWHCIATVTEE